MQNCIKRAFLSFFNAKKWAMLHKTALPTQICIVMRPKYLLVNVAVAESQEVENRVESASRY